jgi:hypothetical protein
MRKAIENLSQLDGDHKDPKIKAYLAIIEDIQGLSTMADSVLSKFTVMDKNWFVKKILKMFS